MKRLIKRLLITGMAAGIGIGTVPGLLGTSEIFAQDDDKAVVEQEKDTSGSEKSSDEIKVSDEKDDDKKRDNHDHEDDDHHDEDNGHYDNDDDDDYDSDDNKKEDDKPDDSKDSVESTESEKPSDTDSTVNQEETKESTEQEETDSTQQSETEEAETTQSSESEEAETTQSSESEEAETTQPSEAEEAETTQPSEEPEPEDSEDDEPVIRILPNVNGKITMENENGQEEIKPGDKVTLKAEPNKGYRFVGFYIYENGADITNSLNIDENNSFIMPQKRILVTARFEYSLIHEIEITDIKSSFEVGDKFEFTGNIDGGGTYVLLAEVWLDDDDETGITSSEIINEQLRNDGIELSEIVEAGEKYHYAVLILAAEGYEFADDIKLIYNGKEYFPSKENSTDRMIVFENVLSFGEKINKPKSSNEGGSASQTATVTTSSGTKTVKVAKQVVRQVVRYVTTTQVVQSGGATGGTTTRVVYRTVNGTSTKAAATGDKSIHPGVWGAIAVAAGSGVVSGIVVGRKRKRK